MEKQPFNRKKTVNNDQFFYYLVISKFDTLRVSMYFFCVCVGMMSRIYFFLKKSSLFFKLISKAQFTDLGFF